MAKVENIEKEVLAVLGATLDNHVNLREIILGWPESNRSLKMPTLSILAGEPDYQVFPPFFHSKETVTNHETIVNYVTGQYNWNLQVDLWCRSAEERHDLFQDLYQAFHSQLSQGIGNLNLTLDNYHGIVASYLFNGYNFIDGEEASQTKTWRAQISCLANCFAVSSDKQYIITEEPELDFYITNDAS